MQILCDCIILDMPANPTLTQSSVENDLKSQGAQIFGVMGAQR